MEKYTKIDDRNVEVETTTITKTVISLDSLIYERDSLIKTQENNTQEAIDKNAQIQTMVDSLNERIESFKNLGVKTEEEITEEVTE